MNPQNKQFKKLRDFWYKKLADTGFEDAEENLEGYADPVLKDWSSSHHKALKNAGTREASENYYRLAGHFLHDHTFDNKAEKYIWQYHTDGIGHRDIANLLKKHKITVPRNSILVIIRKLKKLMTIKYGIVDEQK